MKFPMSWFILLAISLQLTNGARILGVFPFNMKSHSIMINAIVEELIARGHHMDVITAYPLPPSTPNYTAIDISPGFNFWPEVYSKLNMKSIKDMSSRSFWGLKAAHEVLGYFPNDYALSHPGVQRLLHSANQHYDLILIEQIYQEAFLMLSHQFRAPMVSISTFGWNSYFASMFGSFGPWSHVPHDLLTFSDSMSFWQRLENVYYCMSDKYWRHFRHIPQQQALADKYFAHLPEPRPSVDVLSRSVSVILQNEHTPMNVVRPNVPGIIDVGGIHIKPVQPLAADLKKFLDEATDGVIYFSFGTQIASKDIPPEEMSAFVQVFGEFSTMKVLWKRESDNVDQMPGNVLTRKWLPQNDILAHPNVKLFITHGGLLGSQEGMFHGVPMLGIPFYADQHTNARRAEVWGYGLKLDFNNITVEGLRWAISELLYNPTYGEKVQEYSRVFRERSRSPMETAMFWIEYVIKFRGADHLRSAGRDLTWYSYLLLDIVLAVILVGIIVAMGSWFAVRWLIAKVRYFSNADFNHVDKIK